MYVMAILRHSPENCATFNEASKKNTQVAMKQLDSLTAKHGVKLAGFWNDIPGHTVYTIYDTPNIDACWALFGEPEMASLLAHNTGEMKVVLSLEESTATV